MKNRLVFLLFIFIGVYGEAKDQATSVELEWEKIQDATIYELEVYSLNKKLLKNVRQKTPTFTLELPLGQYMARMRVADERQVYGVWSELSQFLVSLQVPKITQDKPLQLKPDPKTLKVVAPIRWEASPLATQYRIEIFDDNGVKVVSKIVKSTSVRMTLPPGVYQYQVIAMTNTGEESVPQQERQTIAVDRLQLESPIFEQNKEVQWKTHPSAITEGTLEYLPLMGETWSFVKNITFAQEKVFKKSPELKPGQYRLTLWSKAKGWVDSAKVSREFVIKPDEKTLPQGSF